MWRSLCALLGGRRAPESNPKADAGAGFRNNESHADQLFFFNLDFDKLNGIVACDGPKRHIRRYLRQNKEIRLLFHDRRSARTHSISLTSRMHSSAFHFSTQQNSVAKKQICGSGKFMKLSLAKALCLWSLRPAVDKVDRAVGRSR